MLALAAINFNKNTRDVTVPVGGTTSTGPVRERQSAPSQKYRQTCCPCRDCVSSVEYRELSCDRDPVVHRGLSR
ncbi:hypothetical protein NDU88_001680 [Pleurodeles waltl]|uniref:Uncharacterized protein n=1 Tax=Pleurodeles waltl TaxID=8319 RepID=A0AAV7VB35_PLEWA|nr:hypothetical protein NDU88_001680 [Pleurodeles waltl]